MEQTQKIYEVEPNIPHMPYLQANQKYTLIIPQGVLYGYTSQITLTNSEYIIKFWARVAYQGQYQLHILAIPKQSANIDLSKKYFRMTFNSDISQGIQLSQKAPLYVMNGFTQSDPKRNYSAYMIQWRNGVKVITKDDITNICTEDLLKFFEEQANFIEQNSTVVRPIGFEPGFGAIKSQLCIDFVIDDSYYPTWTFLNQQGDVKRIQYVSNILTLPNNLRPGEKQQILSRNLGYAALYVPDYKIVIGKHQHLGLPSLYDYDQYQHKKKLPQIGAFYSFKDSSKGKKNSLDQIAELPISLNEEENESILSLYFSQDSKVDSFNAFSTNPNKSQIYLAKQFGKSTKKYNKVQFDGLGVDSFLIDQKEEDLLFKEQLSLDLTKKIRFVIVDVYNKTVCDTVDKIKYAKFPHIIVLNGPQAIIEKVNVVDNRFYSKDVPVSQFLIDSGYTTPQFCLLLLDLIAKQNGTQKINLSNISKIITETIEWRLKCLVPKVIQDEHKKEFNIVNDIVSYSYDPSGY